MSASMKRSASPLPRHFDDIRRIRISDAAKKDGSRQSTVVPSTAVGVEQPSRGQEILSLSPSLQQDLKHININDLILQTTLQLASEGKRLVRAPRLLSDGIAFDWVSDVTAPSQDIRSLLSVEGIRSEDLDRVLLRATPVPTYRSATEESTGIPHPDTHCNSVALNMARNEASMGLALNPIVVDDDVGEGAFTRPSVRGADVPPAPAPQRRSVHSHDVDLHISMPGCPPHSMGNRGGNDRRWPPDSSPDLIDVSRQLGHEVPAFGDIAQVPELPVAPNSEPSGHPCVRRPDYGSWKSFAEDSSDAETHLSSRESSVARTSPPPLHTHAVPALPFLPYSYDTCGLLSDDKSLTFPGPSRPEHTETSHSPRHEHSDSTPRRDPALPRANSYPPRDQVTESSSPSHSINQSRDDSDDNMKYTSVKKPKPRSDTASSRNPRIGRSNTTGTRRTRPGAPDSGCTGQPTSGLSGNSDINPDDNSENEHERRCEPTSGHTVVIPKADYARGRRLLAPANPDNPLTTILMRGEAHFVDQRQKMRITTYSLPVEDDARHVEDACLIGDDTVVVGYNRGPCQVSLISVGDDQRPRRHDLSYRAHSTVIENRTLGKTFPNRGIACLAPVAGNIFLSGGHDKTVHRWKIVHGSDRKKGHEGWSASSVRIPMDHTQSVQALAYCGWNETVYSAAGDRIASTKLHALAHAESERVSGKITQVHVHPQDPRLVALEIDHMDYQVQLYDMRAGSFARKPWLEFGYRTTPYADPPKTTRTIADTTGNANASSSWPGSISTPKPGTRYTRGSTMNSLFARGYSDGVVLVWDYRNGAQKKVLERFQFQRLAEVAHTVLCGSDVIAYGAYSVTFWSLLGARA